MMTCQREENIKKRLNQIFRHVFNNDNIEIVDEISPKDIEDWDSLAHVTLVVAIEREFDLRLSAAELGKIENVGSILSILYKRATK